LALIAICYAIAAPTSDRREQPLLRKFTLSHSKSALTANCKTTADNLKQVLPADWSVSIHEPFVLAGDCQQEHLSRYYRDTIAPTARALSIQYFDTPPTWPVTVVLCTSEASYRECHRCLRVRERNEYAGTYSRSEHRVIANIATGDGTVAHELTHALAHADFAELPEWLDEGLASLYEECEFSSDGLRLVGLQNWRGVALRNAAQMQKLRSIEEMATATFASADASIDYAHARYFCLFLQERNLLESFYRKCRSHTKDDPDGTKSLTELLQIENLSSLDTQFQQWLRARKPDG
jgi:hypothetical protein